MAEDNEGHVLMATRALKGRPLTIEISIIRSGEDFADAIRLTVVRLPLNDQ